jgi:AraC family transcriptional regulator, arabinose operon regulatory protein
VSRGAKASSNNPLYAERNRHSAAHPLRIQVILRALDQQPTLTAADVATMVGLSTSRLEHLFKNELGTNMRAYKQERKLQHAHQLLRDPTLRIKEVRCLCGISDASNFTHVFKLRFGVTPSAFRARVRGSQ